MGRKNRIFKGIMIVSLAWILSGCGFQNSEYKEGMALAEDGKYEEAIDHFEAALAKKANVETYLAYGMSLNHVKRYEDAMNAFETALDQKKVSDAEKKQIYYGEAIASYGKGEFASVCLYTSRALKIDTLESMNSDIRYTGMLALEQSGDYSQAMDEAINIIHEDEKYMDAYMVLAQLQQMSGKGEHAIETYLAAIEEDDSFYDAYFALYQQYQTMGQEDAAEDILDKVLNLKAKKEKEMLAVGRANLYIQDYERAEDYFNQAYEEGNKEGLYYLGILQKNKEDASGAISYLKKYLEEAKEKSVIDAYNQLAALLMEQREYEQAQEYLSQGLSHGMSDSYQVLLRNQVILYEKQNEYKKALSAAEEYLKIYPNDSNMKKEKKFITTRIK